VAQVTRGRDVLRINLGVEDLGRIRFGAAPAPILEMVLMLFELRQRPLLAGGGEGNWRGTVRSAFPATARPLLQLVPSRRRALYLDVLTTDADEAFHLVRDTPRSVHANNLSRIEHMKVAPTPLWLRRYMDGDTEILQALDRALRAFHNTCLAPRWPLVTKLFHHDVAHHTTTFRQHGITAVLNSLSPDLRLNGHTLEGRYPWDREVRLEGQGLVLVPSAFWTGYPLITWDPQDQSRYVLIYPAHRDADQKPGSASALERVLGQTRTAVLRCLWQPRTTGGIARSARISLSSASEQATSLREAGLITSRRHGQAVEHRLTNLGRSLLGEQNQA
jgi:DNA-binding transcriptional ArsR family regulator